MGETLSKTEILLEKCEQCVSWARENPNEEINELTVLETFWENQQGMEFSTEEDFLEVAESMAAKIRELSAFINQNLDPTKCPPEGIPDRVISGGSA